MKPAKILHVVALLWNRVVPDWLFRFRYCHIFRLDFVPPEMSMPEDLRLVWASTEKEIEQAVDIAQNPLDPTERAGHRAALAYLGDRPVAAVWVAADRFFERELGLAFELPQSSRWLYCAHVVKPFRQQGVYRALLAFVLHQQLATDQSPLYAAVTVVNHASVQAHQRFGSRIASVMAWRLFAVSAVWARGEAAVRRKWSWNCYYRPVMVRINRKHQSRATKQSSTR